MAISFCFFTVPNMSSIQRETKNSLEHQNSVNHDIYLVPATDKLHLALLMKVTDMPPKASRLMTSDRMATSPDSKPYTGEGDVPSIVAISFFSSKWRCVQSIHFQTNPGTHQYFIFQKIFRERYLAASCVNLSIILGTLMISLSPTCTSVEAHFYLKLN